MLRVIDAGVFEAGACSLTSSRPQALRALRPPSDAQADTLGIGSVDATLQHSGFTDSSQIRGAAIVGGDQPCVRMPCSA